MWFLVIILLNTDTLKSEERNTPLLLGRTEEGKHTLNYN